jgi:proteasome lid subunit RPN8/RPN11
MLSTKVKATLIEAIRDAAPDEICGVILGSRSAAEFLRLRNLSGGRSFFIGPAELARARRLAIATDRELLAIVHSHAHTVALSDNDQTGLAASELPWLVVAPDKGGRLQTALYHPLRDS